MMPRLSLGELEAWFYGVLFSVFWQDCPLHMQSCCERSSCRAQGGDPGCGSSSALGVGFCEMVVGDIPNKARCRLLGCLVAVSWRV